MSESDAQTSWSIQEVARASGVTARTLRYYDEIELLSPSGVGANGHRYYGRDRLLRLQQILLLRDTGLNLATIRDVVDDQRDPAEVLRDHHADLLATRKRIDGIAATVAATIRHLEEGTDMPAQDLFASMTPERAHYLSSLPRKRVAAGALFSNNLGHTLLVAPTYRPHWQLPGGVVEADESPRAAATRAVRRELGIHIQLGRLLVVDWVAPQAGRVEGLLFVYDGGLLAAEQTGTIVLPSDELREWAWCSDAQLAERLPSHMLSRTRSALEAQARGSTCYAEDGLTVPA